jgi:hypothetical protein
MTQELTTPPAGVGIQVVKSSDDQLVIAVPPGGKRARSIGCFGIAWLGITATVSGGFLFVDNAEQNGGDGPPLLILIPFLGIFWAVGIGMIVAWVRMRFTQILLSVERDQFAIQKTLLGRKQLTKIPLDENSHAELVESYSENDQPVYAIQMEGVGETEKFATGLSYEEKRWLARSINQFLGVDQRSPSRIRGTDARPEFCDDCGSELMIGDGKRVCPDCGRVYLDNLEEDSEGSSDDDLSAMTDPSGTPARILERPPALDPYELPGDSKIRIDLDDGETLAFSYGIQVPLILKIFAGSFLTFFCCMWYGVVGTFIVGAIGGDDPLAIKLGILAFTSIFVISGLMPLGMLLSLFFGRGSIRLSRDKIVGSIGVLFLKKKKSISTESVSDVGLATTMLSNRQFRRQGVRHSTLTLGPLSSQMGVVIKSSEFNMPLTMSSDAQFNEQVAGLVRFQLERLGVGLPND